MWNTTSQPDEMEISKAVKSGLRRVHFNLDQVGKFLKMAAGTNKFMSSQGLLVNMAKDLKDYCNSSYITGQLKISPETDRTQTKLTIDLYLSHYDTKDHSVAIDTSSLLFLSNALWLHIEKVVALNRTTEKVYISMKED